MDIHKPAAAFSAVFFAVGLILVFAFSKYEIKDGATMLVALLFIPLVVYGAVSGKLLELTGPGGLGLKLQAAARQNVDSAATLLTEKVRQLQKIEKQSNADLNRLVSTIERGRPIALAFRYGKQNYYDSYVAENYVTTLLEYDPEMIIIIIDDKSEQFIAMIEGNAFLGLSRTEEQRIIKAIGSADLNYIKQFPQFLFKGISEKKTNADALREMSALNTKTLVVLDEANKPHAVVKRDDIVAHILEKLTA